jgi:hypothetical protein
MTYEPCSNVKGWNEYFTKNSLEVKEYTTNYQYDNKEFTLKLRVSLLNYGNFYAWELITDNVPQIMKPDHQFHPFTYIDCEYINLYHDGSSIYIGGINAKNKVMDSLFEMIIMSDEELKKYSGHVWHSQYRSHLIKSLHDLWD